ncbi:MAG: hypothetical protein AAF355_12795 [Myxococcota bacterium]
MGLVVFRRLRGFSLGGGQRLSLGLLLVLLAAVLGCDKGLRVYLQGLGMADVDLPVTVVFRKVDEERWSRDRYEDIVEMVESGDESILAIRTVYPGKRLLVELPEGEGPVGAYILYSTPGPRWKHLLRGSSGVRRIVIQPNEAPR